jgi:hypothetical protein
MVSLAFTVGSKQLTGRYPTSISKLALGDAALVHWPLKMRP